MRPENPHPRPCFCPSSQAAITCPNPQPQPGPRRSSHVAHLWHAANELPNPQPWPWPANGRSPASACLIPLLPPPPLPSPNPALKYSVMIPKPCVPQGKRRKKRLRNLLFLLPCVRIPSHVSLARSGRPPSVVRTPQLRSQLRRIPSIHRQLRPATPIHASVARPGGHRQSCEPSPTPPSSPAPSHCRPASARGEGIVPSPRPQPPSSHPATVSCPNPRPRLPRPDQPPSVVRIPASTVPPFAPAIHRQLCESQRLVHAPIVPASPRQLG